MATIAEARLREDAPEVRWVLFIGGIQFQFTTDNGQGEGTLLGTGASSWIGLSEAAIGGVEVVGARTVLPGLQMPATWRESIDVKGNDMDPNPVTFRLHDDEAGTLANLFGREDKLFDILRERLAPGVAALPATALGQGGPLIGLHGRNIGIERVGASGERRLFPVLPEALVGPDHAVHQDVEGPGELPPIKVSDEPLAWAGRMVTIYAIYRDPDSTATDASAWYTWDEQDVIEGGLTNRRWVGKVIGVIRQKGRVFELRCHGRDGLYRKQLGRVSTAQWQPISSERLRTATDSGFAVVFEERGTNGIPSQFNGSVFDTDLTEGVQLEMTAEIDVIISDAVDGTSVNFTPGGGDLVDWLQGATNQEADAGMQGAQFWLRKRDQVSLQAKLIMFIAMHSRDWRQLGYEPESQNFDTINGATENIFQIKFTKLVSGQNLMATLDTGFPVPGDGYWMGRFSTVKEGVGESIADSNDWDNDGAKRFYSPKFPGEPFTLDLAGNGQLVRLGGSISPYIEGQLTIHHGGGDVDGVPSNFARFFALRGKVQKLVPGSGGALVVGEPEDTIQVVELEWEDTNYGTIDPGTGAQPATILTKWMDPRTFGFNHERLQGLEFWTGVGGSNNEGRIEAVPLSAYAYLLDDSPEFAHSLWSQVLLSTGSGGGYSGVSITDGDNSPGALPADLFFGSDVELADLGCAVPVSLVADLDTIQDAFDTAVGGWNGPLNRVRYAYIGPFLAQDMLSSLMRSRRLVWRGHGDVLGLVKLAPFSPEDADVTINQSDLYARDDDPRSLEPDQQPNPVGYLDGVNLAYRLAPDTGKTVQTFTVRSQDSEASARTGELIETIVDHGLIAWDWGAPEGIGTTPWFTEFRQEWAFNAAEFFSLDHFSITINVSRPKGQDLRFGTRVLLNNPWPADNAGGYGIINHVGIVTAVDVDTSTHAVEVEIFVFAGQFQGVKVFAPMARILEQTGAVLRLDSDQYLHGNSNIRDTDGYVEPSWSPTGGSLRVNVLTRIGETYSVGAMLQVVSFDEGASEITLSAPPDTDTEFADRWLIHCPFGSQPANDWPRVVFGVIVRDDLTHGAGSTVGRPFYP